MTTSDRAEQTVLIVDDSEFDRLLLRKALTKKGKFRILEAINSETCLQTLAENSVDLILMDILLGEESGIELLGKLRQQKNHIELPVIMITAKTESKDIVTALEAGANDYITKPIIFDVALLRISTQLEVSRLSKEMGRLKEMTAISAMVTTYNHEINNPLAIAIMNFELFERDRTNDLALERVKKALGRITEIVRQIKDCAQDLKFETYSNSGSKMVKLKGS